jgi:hypothetical protein
MLVILYIALGYFTGLFWQAKNDVQLAITEKIVWLAAWPIFVVVSFLRS